MERFDPTSKTVTEAVSANYQTEQARLEVITGPDKGLTHDFQFSTRLGTRSIADVKLRDPKVSGLHCEILVGNGLTVRDLGSKNGTYLGGFQVRDAVVPSGKVITVGDTQIRLVLTDVKVEVPTLKVNAYHGLIGRSAPMRALTAQIERMRGSDPTVLISGETGTGKERIAEALHLTSARAQAPLVVVDCTSLSPSLIESQLFGHERGAFTGADSRREGAFERGAGGTVFLDEIGELPLPLQSKLLRVTEQRQVQRVGAAAPIPVDVRLIAATHRDLALEVSRGRFREDLYYRLSVVNLHVPPLRERKEDIPLLTIEFLKQLGLDPQASLSPESLGELDRHDWPGNVRELKNTIERAAALLEPPRVSSDVIVPPSSSPESVEAVDLNVPLLEGRARLMAAYEAAYLKKLLSLCNGNVSEVARRAKMDRMAIHRMLLRLNLRGES
jgi:DNA-binding NtrC family response regulator